MAHDVFISYSTKDHQVANAVCAYLERERIRCWIAPRDIRPGQNYGEAIVQGLNGCNVLVIIFSENSNNSRHVIKEVERAVSKGSVVVPFRVQDILPSGAMEYFLSSEHWLDALTPPLDSHLIKLVSTVRAVVKGEEEAHATESKPQKQIDTSASAEFEEVAPSDWYRSGKSNPIKGFFRKIFEERD